jgi:hypothetical protein
MKSARTKIILAAVVLSLVAPVAGCSNTEDEVTLPPDTELTVTLSTMTRSDRATPGQTLSGTLARSVVIGETTVLEAGSDVVLKIEESKSAEGDAPARVVLRLTSVDVDSGRAEIECDPLEIVGDREGMSDTEKVAAGTVGGAVIGGITKGGKGAAVGGVLGAMAGGVIAVSTKGDAIVLPAGQRLLFSTTGANEIPRP